MVFGAMNDDTMRDKGYRVGVGGGGMCIPEWQVSVVLTQASKVKASVSKPCPPPKLPSKPVRSVAKPQKKN